MIFWFSGTGNSLWAAKELAAALNDTLIDIAQEHTRGHHDYSLRPGESIGWVFPVHAWGPPPMVCDFARQLSIDNYTTSTHCYMVATCGDDSGLTVEILQKALGNITLNAAFTLQMPNTYICLPGFDVDSHDLEHNKLMAAKERIGHLVTAIAERRNVTDVVRGTMPWTKSRILRPGFLMTCMGDGKFLADNDACTRCGKCVLQCPVGNITQDTNGKPQWHGNCTMCLRCLHLCPTRAINYGKGTAKKGRYHHSDMK